CGVTRPPRPAKRTAVANEVLTERTPAPCHSTKCSLTRPSRPSGAGVREVEEEWGPAAGGCCFPPHLQAADKRCLRPSRRWTGQRPCAGMLPQSQQPCFRCRDRSE